MKKFLLSVLALIVLVGTVFAHSTAWSQSDCLYSEACFLSGYSSEGDVITDSQAILTTYPEKTVLLDLIDHFGTFNGVSPVAAVTYEELGVSSWYTISCLNCDTIGNPLNVITYNGIKSRSGINIQFC